MSGAPKLMERCTRMQKIKHIGELLKGYSMWAQKWLRRLTDVDTEKWEYSPYSDWYRLSWVALLLVCLSALLHGYVWVMAQRIAEGGVDEYQPLTAVSREELARAVAAQAEREVEHERILSGLPAVDRTP